MRPIPSSTTICSANRTVAQSRLFSSSYTHASLLARCGALGLMFGGAWAGAQAPNPHFTHVQNAVAMAADNNQNGPRVVAENGRVMGITSSNGNFGSVNVGSTSPAPISIVFTFDAAQTLGTMFVVTQGATGLDFTDAGTGTCKAGSSYGIGDSCTVDASFAPKFPGARYGAAKLIDGAGNLLATGYLQGTGVGPLLNFLPGTQSVITNSPYEPRGVALDGNGNVYITDVNYRVLKETPEAGGYSESVIVKDYSINPYGIAVDGSGNVFVVDGMGYQVLKETPFAGGYIQSVIANRANNGLAYPYGVAVDGSGNVYIADWGYAQVLKETLSGDSYTQTVVADRANNGLTYPYGVAVDGSDNVYIADSYFDPVLRVNAGRVLKETPSADGYTETIIATAASNGLVSPAGVAVDGSGNVYIADGFRDPFSGIDSSRVLKETPSAGGYTQSLIANALNNGISSPVGVVVDGSGNVYFTDAGNNRALKEDLADPQSLTVGATSAGSPKALTVVNEGNAALVFPIPATGDNPSVSANFSWDPSSTCKQSKSSSSVSVAIAAGARCTMAFDFEPSSGGTFSGTAELTDNNLNVTGAAQRIPLIGVLGAQTINFPQLPSPVYKGFAPTTLHATGGGSGNPVIFSIVSGPGTLSGTNNSVLNSNGWGTIVIAANQAGNLDYSAAPQVTQSVTVLYSQDAALTAPAPGSSLTSSTATFTWSMGIGATEYMLYLGSTGVRSGNLYHSVPMTVTSVNVTGLPTNGGTIYARLYSLIGGAWHALDYSYLAESLATLTSPAPNTTLTGSNVTFNWSAGIGVTKYELYLGTGVASDNLYHSGYITAKSVNVTGLPVNGEKIYARLYSYIGGTWQYLDYIYTAQ